MSPNNAKTEVLDATDAGAETSPKARAFRAAVCDVTSKVCVEHYGKELRAIILTGSLARDEATFVEEGLQWKVLGDADFFLIFRPRSPLPAASATEFLQQEIGRQLLERGLLCNVGVSPAYASYLRALPAHISPYELRTCGRVVWGERRILSLIPGFSAAEISPEDAWCLLANRIIEQLEGIIPLADKPEGIPEDLRYRTVKLYLDMATSYLLFVGSYTPSYCDRELALRRLAEQSQSGIAAPFPLRGFAERVSTCTSFKLHPKDGEKDCGQEHRRLWEDSFFYAHRLWRWELMRLTGAPQGLSDRELLSRWMALQPVAKRIRGWASVLRRSGWYRSWREWPRWIRHGWRASPRYWVYGAATEVFFRLPSLLASPAHPLEPESDWMELAGWLPSAGERELDGDLLGWRRLAAMTARNYRQFLETTLA